MKTNTDWTIRIEPNDDSLVLFTDFTGEMPNSKAYIELLGALGKWADKHCKKELRVKSFPQIMHVGG